MSAHAKLMADTYSTGSFSRIVDAGGNEGFMNLGYASDRLRPGSTATRQRRLAYMIFDAVAPQGGNVILDLGCGKGGMVHLIGHSVPGAQVVGVNIDPHQLPVPGEANVSFRIGDAEQDWPFEDNSADTVLAIELLSHVRNKAALAAECKRVLREPGRLVLAFIALSRPYESFTAVQRRHLDQVAALFNEQAADIPTRADVAETFSKAGFKVASAQDLTDGVFSPRHEEFLSMLRRLSHANKALRLGYAAYASWRWRVDVSEFRRFLDVSTAEHPCRFYEYHLMTLTAETRENSTPAGTGVLEAMKGNQLT